MERKKEGELGKKKYERERERGGGGGGGGDRKRFTSIIIVLESFGILLNAAFRQR